MHKALLFFFLLFFIACSSKEETQRKEYALLGHYMDVIPPAHSDTSLALVMLGDWGKFSDSLEAVRDAIIQLASNRHMDHIITAGDNFYAGDDFELQFVDIDPSFKLVQ